MKFVTLQMRPFPVAPSASDDEMRAFTAAHSVRECATVTEIVAIELMRRGLHRVRTGGRFYCAIEARIVAQLIAREVDLGEIAAQIEEARWENPPIQPQREIYRRNRSMSKTKTRAPKEAPTFTPTRLHPTAPPRGFVPPMFRDPDKAKKPETQAKSEPEIHQMSDSALNRYARGLSPLEAETLVRLIRFELQTMGMPPSTRVGGTMWQKARRKVISGLKHYETDLGEVRSDMLAPNAPSRF